MIRNGIKFKIMFRICVLVAVLLIITGLAMYYVFSSILLNKATEDTSSGIEKLSRDIENIIDDVYRFSQYLSVSPEIKNFLANNQYGSQLDKINAVKMIMEYLQNPMFLKEYIHSVALINKNGDVFWTLSPYDNYFKNILLENGLQEYASTKKSGFSSKYTLPLKFNMNDQVEIISYFSNRYYVNNREAYGKLAINLNLNYLLKDVSMHEQEFDNLAIYNEQGDILYCKRVDKPFLALQSDQFNLSVTETKNGFYFSNTITNCHWRIVGFLDRSSILKKMNYSAIAVIVLSLLISLVLTVVLVLPILLKTVQQIVTLNTGMKAVAQGNLNTRISLTGAKEFEELEDGFHKMTTELSLYMNEAFENLRAKQRISFELLLAQINPHFIYNTLNSVIYLARKKKHEEIIEMMDAFIFLLQDTIQLGDNKIYATVAEELEVVKKYITIQKYRYADRFEVSIEADERLNSVQIPKSLLQPLVENAILHGICPKNGKGQIDISVSAAGDEQISIFVRDNGVGIEPESIERILKHSENYFSEHNRSKLRSIGIGNITGKLEYIYKKNYRFDIESRVNSGTAVHIVLPVIAPSVDGEYSV